VKNARCYWLLLAEGHLSRRLFGSMLRMIAAPPLANQEREQTGAQQSSGGDMRQRRGTAEAGNIADESVGWPKRAAKPPKRSQGGKVESKAQMRYDSGRM
jgi:hypothetical protein